MTAVGRLWPGALRASERRALRGAPLGTHDRRPDVLVVGGGIMGVAAAHACEEGGLGDVVLVEAADELGAGATGGAAGLLAPEPHHGVDPDALVALGRHSLAAWRRLHQAIPGGLGLVDLDWLGLLASAGAWEGRSPAARPADHETVARLVPGLAGEWVGMLVPDQARLNPLVAVARLARRLRRVVTGVRALSDRVGGGAVREVETTAGRVSPGAVLFATGDPPALGGLGLSVPADRVKGHLVCTGPVPAPMPWHGTVDPIGTHLGDGRVLVGGTLEPGDDDPTVRGEVVEEMVAKAARLLPALAEAGVTCAWTCFRPHHPDGMPVIDRVPGVDNAWLTSGHFRTGVLLAPATAALLAHWVATGSRPPVAGAFGCGRFSSSDAPHAPRLPPGPGRTAPPDGGRAHA